MLVKFKDKDGKVMKIPRGIKTRADFKKLYGDPFQMDKHHSQLSKKYLVTQVIAKPSPDTSINWAISIFIIAILFLKKQIEHLSILFFTKENEYSLILISGTIAFLFYLWRSMVVFFDKKAAEKFNES